jgi:hypothetical protein
MPCDHQRLGAPLHRFGVPFLLERVALVRLHAAARTKVSSRS